MRFRSAHTLLRNRWAYMTTREDSPSDHLGQIVPVKRPSAPESRRPQLAVLSETSERIRLRPHESILGGSDDSGVERPRSTLRRRWTVIDRRALPPLGCLSGQAPVVLRVCRVCALRCRSRSGGWRVGPDNRVQHVLALRQRASMRPRSFDRGNDKKRRPAFRVWGFLPEPMGRTADLKSRSALPPVG